MPRIKQPTEFEIVVDGETYVWRFHRRPQWSGPAADWRGKVVLVNFYSSYCRLCALEIGTIESAVEQYGARGLVVLMLGVDKLEDKARVARMLGIYNLQGAMVDDLTVTGFQRLSLIHISEPTRPY